MSLKLHTNIPNLFLFALQTFVIYHENHLTATQIFVYKLMDGLGGRVDGVRVANPADEEVNLYFENPETLKSNDFLQNLLYLTQLGTEVDRDFCTVKRIVKMLEKNAVYACISAGS